MGDAGFVASTVLPVIPTIRDSRSLEVPRFRVWAQGSSRKPFSPRQGMWSSTKYNQ